MPATLLPSARVTGLRVFPVKSLRGYDVQSADVEQCGFAGDRRRLVVDAEGTFLTQRQFPAMARITVRPAPDGLLLDAPHVGEHTVAVPEAGSRRIEVTVWNSRVPAALAQDAAGAWLSKAIGTACRLVYLDDPRARTVDPDYSDVDDRVSFADGFPVLLATDESLDDLNRRLATPIPMARFRPNLVISGAPGWAEDTWKRVQIGTAVFRLVKPCARCVVTTLDQETGEKPVPDEPLRTLSKFRRARGGVMFGQNLIPERLGRIALGDEVTVLDAGASNLLATG